MQNCSFFCKGWWPFILFPLALLIPLLYFQWHAIEKDVATNSHNDLHSQGHEWAEVITHNRGREVLIAGVAPSSDAVEQARKLALSAEGVRSVEFVSNNIAVQEPSPAQLNAMVTGDSVVLRGTVANQSTIDSLVAQAEAVFGAGKVVNKMSIGDNIAELSDMRGLFNALASSEAIGTVTAAINGNSAELSGEVLSDDSRAQLGGRLSDILSGRVKNNLTVAAPPPIERDVCEDLVNELLASGKINFNTSEAVIASDSFTLLDQINDTAKRCPDAKFEIAGHTDSTGNAANNQVLSQQRAQAVLNYLAEKGLSDTQFSAIGYGESKPIASNNTAAGRANNRRIEFKLKN